jgi:hypothetical protein
VQGVLDKQNLPSAWRPTDLSRIEALNRQFEKRYERYFSTDPLLSRELVSFQANKSRAVYRWYKFKEAFSAGLVEYLLSRYRIDKGTLLDPFAGSGTALFASSETGLTADGIELIPIGQQIVETKRLIERGLSPAQIRTLSKWMSKAPWRRVRPRDPLPELRITKGAYPEETADSISRFLAAIDQGSYGQKHSFFCLALHTGGHQLHSERWTVSTMGPPVRSTSRKEDFQQRRNTAI